MSDQLSETIRRAPHGMEIPYFLMARETAQKKAMSYEALGCLSYLLSKPGDWRLQPKDLEREGAGRDKVYRILKELREHRHLYLDEKRDETGKVIGYEYLIFEQPYPLPEKPDTAEPYTAKPHITEYREVQSIERTERGAPSPRSLFAALSQVTPGTRKPRGEEIERTSWALSDPELPDICKALWRVFSPLNSKLKVSAKQKAELEAEVITPANDKPYASPSEMYSAYPAAFEEFLVKLKDWMVKQRDVPINMGNIVKFVRGYHFKGIGWFNHMPASAKQTVADAPASGNLDALQEFISG